MQSNLIAKLNEFTGTVHYHQYSELMPDILFTDGIEYLRANGYEWLLDRIVSIYTTRKDLQDKEQIMFEIISSNDDVVIKIHESEAELILHSETINKSFPEPGIKILLESNIIFLLSENG